LHFGLKFVLIFEANEFVKKKKKKILYSFIFTKEFKKTFWGILKKYIARFKEFKVWCTV
jgi:hypothetical protein